MATAMARTKPIKNGMLIRFMRKPPAAADTAGHAVAEPECGSDQLEMSNSWTPGDP